MIVYTRHNVTDNGGTIVGVNDYTTAELYVMRVTKNGTPSRTASRTRSA